MKSGLLSFFVVLYTKLKDSCGLFSRLRDKKGEIMGCITVKEWRGNLVGKEQIMQKTASTGKCVF